MKRLLQIKKHIFGVLICMISLCGFTKIIEWGKHNFAQAKRHDEVFVQAAQKYIQSLKIYNQFTVQATFDSMLLTDSLRMLYVDYYVKNHGMSKEQEQMMRQRQFNENRYFVSVYVCAWQKEQWYPDIKSLFTGQSQKSTELLKGNDAMWSVRMIVAGRQYFPESIRVVDLPVEYRTLFGSRYNQFATVYLVRFPAYDQQQNYIFQPNRSSTIVLQFSSALSHQDAVWKDMVYYLK